MARKKKVTHNFKSRTRDNQREMICRNSIADESYFAWNHLKDLKRCKQWVQVTEKTTAVLCSKCTGKTVPPPEMRKGYVSKGRPRGWQFMKEFVDKDGNVFHKGKEQPKLKGTLKPTKVKPKKKVKRKTKDEILVARHKEKLAVQRQLKKDLDKQKKFLMGDVEK